MAGAPFDPLGQLPPLVNDEAPVAPWSWVPDHWNQPVPGVGVPADTFDAAAQVPDPNEIQMPADDARPQIGFPRDPSVAPILPEQADTSSPPIPAYTSFPDAPPGPPEVDAISGGDWRANVPTAPGGNEYQSPEAHGVPLTDEQRARMFAASSPEEQARMLLADQQRRDAEENKRRAQAALQDEQTALENQHTFKVAQEQARAATAKIDAEAKALAEEKIDTGQNRGILSRIRGILLGVVGGLVQSRQGGPNQGLAILDKEMEQHIAEQKERMANKRAELARRGASVQEQLRMAEADHEAAERWRLATYTRVQNQIATDMQQYDPQGKTALQLGGMYSAIGAQRQKALEAYQDKNFRDYVNAMEEARKQQKALDEHNKALLEQRKLAGGLGSGAGAGAGKLTPEQYAQLHPLIPRDQLPPDSAPRSDKEYNAYFEANRKGAEAAKATGEVSGGERARKFGVAGLVNKDGQPWLARNEGDATDLANKHHIAKELVSILDELADIRDHVGGESKVFNSDEYQRIQVLKPRALALVKSGTQGMSSDEDMKRLEEMVGTADADSFRSQAAKLAESRRRTLSALNSEFGSKGYTGPQISFANPYAGGDRKETPGEKEFKTVLGWQTSQYNYGKDADIIKGHGSPHPDWDARGYSDKQKAYADAAAADLADKTKADAARAKLTEIAKHADSPGYRQYAQSLLTPATTEPDGPVFK